MAINTVSGVNALVAFIDIPSLDALGLTARQVAIIYQANGVYSSWVPGRGTNTLQSLTKGLGYIIVTVAPVDLSAYFIPPIPAGNAGNPGVMSTAAPIFFIGSN